VLRLIGNLPINRNRLINRVACRPHWMWPVLVFGRGASETVNPVEKVEEQDGRKGGGE